MAAREACRVSICCDTKGETEMTRNAIIVGAATVVSVPALALADVGHDDKPGEHSPVEITLEVPDMNAENGRALFVEKGCFACHAVNGVGGEDASPLDAHQMDPVMNPFDFSAKMWQMAPYMIEAQEEAFGEQILFTGTELADIIAFLHNDAEQHLFTEASLSDEARKMLDHGHEGVPGEEAHEEELGHD